MTEALAWALMQQQWAKAILDDLEVLDFAATDFLAYLLGQGEGKVTAAAALFRTNFVKEQKLNHPYAQVLMARRTSARSGEPPCRPLTLPAYEQIILAAAERAGLRDLPALPHSSRHGSAAMATSGKTLSAANPFPELAYRIRGTLRARRKAAG